MGEIFVIIIVLLLLSIPSEIENRKMKQNKMYFANNVVKLPDKKYYKNISLEELKKFNTTDMDSFKNYFYDLFVKFEYACNDLDYNLMNSLSTSELYNNYYTGISLNLKKGHKKIINNIERRNVIIHEAYSSDQKQIVVAIIEIRYNNYTIAKNGDIVRGTRFQKYTEKFEVTFKKEFDKYATTKCPNCGATVTSNKCEYCKSKVNNHEFRIADIKQIKDNEEQ